MRKVWITAGVACIFALGIFIGIWMDWSTWLKRPTKISAQPVLINFEVQRYGLANLIVHPGDILQLSRQAIPYTDVHFSFKGGISQSPCVEVDQPNCTIKGDKPDGPYFFTCVSSDNKPYTCPDPGIQQRSGSLTTEQESLKPVRLFKDVRYVFGHIFGRNTYSLTVQTTVVQTNSAATTQTNTPSQSNQPRGAKAAGSTLPQFSAFVVCPTTTAEIDPLQPSGAQDSTISIPANSELTWVGNSPFTITLKGTQLCGTSSIPSNLIEGSNLAICQIAQSVAPQPYPYNAAFNSGCANPSPDETIEISSSQTRARK